MPIQRRLTASRIRRLTLRAAACALIALWLTVHPQPALASDPADATLGALDLSGVTISFAAATTGYTAEVAYGVRSTTVSATPANSGAQAGIDPPDADPGAAGHQVDLHIGRTTVTVTVTAADDNTTEAYTVVVTRAAAARDASLDVSLTSSHENCRALHKWTNDRAGGNRDPAGVWGDGNIIAVVDQRHALFFSYPIKDHSKAASGACLAYDSVAYFDDGSFWPPNGWKHTGNDHPAAIWGQDRFLYFTDFQDAKVYGFPIERYGYIGRGKVWSSATLHWNWNQLEDAGNLAARDMWSNADTLWVADYDAAKLFAYRVDGRSRAPQHDFDTLQGAGNDDPYGIWSDGATMWVGDRTDSHMYAYDVATRSRVAELEFSIIDNAGGMWSDGVHLWIAEGAPNPGVRVYQMPPNGILSDLRVNGERVGGFASTRRSFSVPTVPQSVTQISVEAVALRADDGATVSYQPAADADPGTPGQQIALNLGENVITILVAYPYVNGRTQTLSHTLRITRSPYTAVPTARATGRDIAMPNVWSIWSDGDTLYTWSPSRKPGGEGRPGWPAGGSPVRAYDLATGAAAADRDIYLVERGRADTHAGVLENLGIFWGHFGTIWAIQSNERFHRTVFYTREPFAYDLTGARVRSEDFFVAPASFTGLQTSPLARADNNQPQGAWTNGETIWISNCTRRDNGSKIFAYRMSNKRRDSAKDFNTLMANGNRCPTGLWSDGSTMWVADTRTLDWPPNRHAHADRRFDGEGDKIYAYNLETRQPVPELDFDTLKGAGNRHATGLWSDGRTMWVADYADNKAYAYHMHPNALLQTLTISGAEFQFVTSETEYTTLAAGSVGRVSVDAAAAFAADGATVVVLPADVDTDAAGHQVDLSFGDNQVTISVTAPDGITTRAYRVNVHRVMLELSLSDIEWEFDPVTTAYALAVPYTLAETTVSAAPSDAAVSIGITPADADSDTANGHQLALQAGGDALLTVSASGGGVTQTYMVTISRAAPSGDATLSALTLSGIALSFDRATTTYNVDAAYDVATTTVTATANHAAASLVITPSDSDTTTAGDQVGLNVGAQTVTIVVTAQDSTTKTYTVTITRAAPPSGDATLSALTLSGIPLSFNPATTTYNVDAAYDVATTTVAATVNHAAASVVITPSDSDTATAGDQVRLNVGAQTVTLVVTAEDGTGKTYTVTITRAAPSGDATLSALAMSGVPLWFDPATTTYNANVADNVATTTVTATANHARASVVITPSDSDTTTAGHQVGLNVGAQTVRLVVTAQDGTTKTYAVRLTRAAPPSSDVDVFVLVVPPPPS